MSAYNLDENVAEYFEFVLEGITYKMRYPNTEEIASMQKLEDGSQEQQDWLYSFVSPANEGDSPVSETLKKVTVKKLQRFSNMIKEEFGAEG